MAVGEEEVRKIARLARLRLTEAEVEKFSHQLSKILEHVEKFRDLDLGGAEATSHVLDLVNQDREDTPWPCLSPAESLYNAPEREDDFFLVPQVVKDR